jgi:hypothetical protein
MVGSARSAAARDGVDATIGDGMIVAVVASVSAAPSPLDDRMVCRYPSTPPVSVTMWTGPTAPKLADAMTRDTVSPQPTPRVPPGRRRVLMNWAPPRPSRAFRTWWSAGSRSWSGTTRASVRPKVRRSSPLSSNASRCSALRLIETRPTRRARSSIRPTEARDTESRRAISSWVSSSL